MHFNSYVKRENLSVAIPTNVKSSLDITGNVFIKVISFNVVSEPVGVHVTQLKILAILQLHVVVMEFVHNDFTQIEDGLPKALVFPTSHSIRFSLKTIPNLKFSFITLLRYAFSFVTRLISLCFLMFAMIFPNTELFMSLKNSFSKSFLALVLNSMYGVNHAL